MNLKNAPKEEIIKHKIVEIVNEAGGLSPIIFVGILEGLKFEILANSIGTDTMEVNPTGDK